MTDFFSVIKARKSVRAYLPTPVEKEKLTKIAESAYSAPNAGPFSISIITNSTLITEINDKALATMKASGNEFLVSSASLPGYQPLYGAPVIVLFSAPSDSPFAAVNAAAGATTAAFAATALGLASVYAVSPTLSINNDADLAKRAGLAEGATSLVGLLVGYEGETAIPSSSHPKGIDIKFVD
jgi:nitroreductase